MAKETHYIVKVLDTDNKFEEVVYTYVDAKTDFQAIKKTKNHVNVKQYVGNKRYEIIIRANGISVQ